MDLTEALIQFTGRPGATHQLQLSYSRRLLWPAKGDADFSWALVALGSAVSVAVVVLVVLLCTYMCMYRHGSSCGTAAIKRNAVAPEPANSEALHASSSQNSRVHVSQAQEGPEVAHIQLANNRLEQHHQLKQDDVSGEQHTDHQQRALLHEQEQHGNQAHAARHNSHCLQNTQHQQQGAQAQFAAQQLQQQQQQQQQQRGSPNQLQPAAAAMPALAAAPRAAAAVPAARPAGLPPPLPPGPIPACALAPVGSRGSRLPPLMVAAQPPLVAPPPAVLSAGGLPMHMLPPGPPPTFAVTTQLSRASSLRASCQSAASTSASFSRWTGPVGSSAASFSQSSDSIAAVPTAEGAVLVASNQHQGGAVQLGSVGSVNGATRSTAGTQQGHQLLAGGTTNHDQQQKQQQQGRNIFCRLADGLQQQSCSFSALLLLQQQRQQVHHKAVLPQAALQPGDQNQPETAAAVLAVLPAVVLQLVPDASRHELQHAEALLLLLLSAMSSSPESSLALDQPGPEGANKAAGATDPAAESAAAAARAAELDQAFITAVQLHAAAAAGQDPREVMLRLQEYITDNQVIMQEVVAEFDGDGDARLDPQELSGLVSIIPGLTGQEQGLILAVAAQLGDANGDGCLSLQELAGVTGAFQQHQRVMARQQQTVLV